MEVTNNILKKYAELIVRTGANVQPGQVVQLTVFCGDADRGLL